ncbi:Arc family DNA-binding protein [Acinetobacter johnsonii]|uniref:Arc family DNA-binding protein n=1 Tax=Acinetobacter johnsonii TaxID=40214 RepID=UPI002935734E|nr:Arc family DNA-binding protein [Acinetobacter johnsonii]MDV2486344.1 Arc family DNA-binding protein [Acinetobacter johnsonii]
MSKHLGVAYNLRLPQELKDKIAESAKGLNRSMNADIVARLEESFEKDDAAEFDKGFVLQVIESQQDQINQLQKMIQDLMNQLRGSKE